MGECVNLSMCYKSNYVYTNSSDDSNGKVK